MFDQGRSEVTEGMLARRRARGNSRSKKSTVTFWDSRANTRRLGGKRGLARNGADSMLRDGAQEQNGTEGSPAEGRQLMCLDVNPEGLMARYQAGDFAAARTLIELISPQLHRFFIVQSRSRMDADDLLQETWLRIHKVRHTYRPGEPVLPWFYAIARHVRVDHYRRVLRTTAREHRLEEMPREAAQPSRESDQTEDLALLLAPLPESQREVLEMLKVEGMSLEEVARATSSSVGSVKQKVHRAYENLRKRMTTTGLRGGRSGVLP
jgi:RNA polymerase sigma-70 factor, ECF subfamily